MSLTKQQISGKLEQIGACWAVTSRKCVLPHEPHDFSPAYHVHPTARYPEQNHIKRFETLAELAEWIKEVERYAEQA